MAITDMIIINDTFYKMAENIEELKELENKLTYIDQPLTSQLSSLLQILCKTSNNPKMIEYLLKVNKSDEKKVQANVVICGYMLS